MTSAERGALEKLDAILAAERRRLERAEALLRQARLRVEQLGKVGGEGDPVMLAYAKARTATSICGRFLDDLAALWTDGK